MSISINANPHKKIMINDVVFNLGFVSYRDHNYLEIKIDDIW